jgi:Protein of unknown function (DUF3761)
MRAALEFTASCGVSEPDGHRSGYLSLLTVLSSLKCVSYLGAGKSRGFSMLLFIRVCLIACLIAGSEYSRADNPSQQQAIPAQATPESDLTTHNHYVNRDGDVVHSPSSTISGTVPAGASAQCGDGTYSFSRNHRGTCSHHGGVARWL